jgi:hypothetical protein
MRTSEMAKSIHSSRINMNAALASFSVDVAASRYDDQTLLAMIEDDMPLNDEQRNQVRTLC